MKQSHLFIEERITRLEYLEEIDALVRQAAPWTEGWVNGEFAKGFFNLAD